MKIPFIQGDKNKEEINEIQIAKITANPFQPRTTFNSNEITELAESIKVHGVIQPVVVREKDSGYELIAGERRMRACKSLGLEKLPAIIRNINDLEMAEIALIENLQRKNLSFLEEARAYQQLIDKFSLTQQELAKKIGKGQSTIANKLRLLTLPIEVSQQLTEYSLSERHARALLKLEDKDSQLSVIKKIVDKELTVKDTEKLIEKILNGEKEKSRVYTVYKDLRLFINTLNNSINEMKEAGLEVEVEKSEADRYVEFKIRLPKGDK